MFKDSMLTVTHRFCFGLPETRFEGRARRPGVPRWLSCLCGTPGRRALPDKAEASFGVLDPKGINKISTRRILAFAGLFTLLTGCLHSEPEKRDTISIQLDTPSAGWSLTPLEAWETDEAIYCLFQLTPPEGMSAQMISSIVSEMQLPASTKPKKRVVLGKTWNWSSAGDIEFPNSLETFKARLSEEARSVELLTPDA